MSLLGKILAILNILGAAGFVTVASMDYAKRHSWAYAVFREDLAIQGLPLTADERNPQGVQITELIGNEPKPPLFPQGKPVLTQEEEVRRVQGEVEARFPATTDTKTLLAHYSALLLPFAQTNSQRERLLAYAAFLDTPQHVAELKKSMELAWKQANEAPAAGQPKKSARDAFEQALAARRLETALPLADGVFAILAANQGKDFGQAFDEALEAQRVEVVKQKEDLFNQALDPPPQKKSPDERRQTIARLLFNLIGPLATDQAEDQKAMQRLLTVVGLSVIGPVIQDQAHTLATIASEVDTQRIRERGLFAQEQQQLLEQIRDKAQQVEADAALLARKQQQQAAHEEELKKRRRDVKQYEDELKESRRLTADHLKTLREMTDALYQIRVKVRDATRLNQEYEKQLRALEVGR